MATLLRTDGTRVPMTLLGDGGLSLPELQALVGGFIEIVWLGGSAGADWTRHHALICNEDGIRLGLAPNVDASRLAGQPIVGDVLDVTILNTGQDTERIV